MFKYGRNIFPGLRRILSRENEEYDYMSVKRVPFNVSGKS
jgi:hypothetical protein